MTALYFASFLATVLERRAWSCRARTTRWGARLGLALVWVAVSGCSDEQWAATIKDPAFPVKGKVLLSGGKPLTAGRIEFIPVKEPGLLAYGAIAPDGTFALQTRSPGDGAIPGEYKVKIMIPEKREFSRFAHYRDEDSSRLRVTVRAEPNTLGAFQLR